MAADCEVHDSLDSTSSYLKAHSRGRGQFASVRARYQTAGRGQRGNGWESAPGENLLMSMLYYPPEGFAASRQFEVSMAVALAVADCVEEVFTSRASECQLPVKVKWPNDVYVADGKIAGILIENSIGTGANLSQCVIGIGLNVNQLVFRSGAPNPVSLRGCLAAAGSFSNGSLEISIDEVAELLDAALRRRLSALKAAGTTGQLHEEYLRRLWRRDGFHLYRALEASLDPAPTAVACGNGADFLAEIVDVAPDGPILLREPDGNLRRFHFKEVTPVLAH